ncbi:hypothetical protein GZ77_08675 [Endozoicomonas montiporae]|uniref:Uncharacterized protein n=2 Tax=Endozoicomonas montiporae TaxID=1027273 RepID=A0A081N7K9_9GAMM|nr:hypothetical protein [Endozoicomonas montiporae]AMO55728.1 hypothetical protein EZMO1_1564 [Endozoicomonas montiporae CL-33]KEQ14432.1 hypothetical protein GZ77_08675 [Endozoicomonas montiporae]
MTYRIRNYFIFSILVATLSTWAGLAFPAESKYSLTHFLKATDPVKLPASEAWKEKAETIADNIHSANWDAPLLRSPEGFEALRYAYEHKWVDINEFLDTQDWLQIQADFAAPETTAFQTLVDKGLLPVRVPAVSVKRIFYTDVAVGKRPNILKSRDTPGAEQFGWLTEVVIDNGIFWDFEAVKLRSQMDDQLGDPEKSRTQIQRKVRQAFIFWYRSLHNASPELSHLSPNGQGGMQILLTSVPFQLEHIRRTHWYALDFAPLYGQLDWNDLIAMRVEDVNPGTIYHPDVATNFFYPHHYYGGASVFLRHDLYHHKALSRLSNNDRRFLAWLHQQEEGILKRMDQAMVAFDGEAREAEYNETDMPLATKMADICHVDQEKLLSGFDYRRYPLTDYWAEPGKHRTLFPGEFADMFHFSTFNTKFSEFMSAYDKRWSDGFVNWKKTLRIILKNQCEDAGYFFKSSFNLYHALLEEMLTKNRDYIYSEFGISVDEMLP